MANSDWGFCNDCKWWQIEPKAKRSKATLGLSIEEELQPFLLRVSGESGCNRFMEGEAARDKGSSEAPSVAVATR